MFQHMREKAFVSVDFKKLRVMKKEIRKLLPSKCEVNFLSTILWVYSVLKLIN